MRLRMPEPYQTSVDPHKAGWGTSAKAPTARPIPAWGEAPGAETGRIRGLKARPMPVRGNTSGASIPNVSFITFDSVFLQERAKLILKRLLTMMGLLPVDVSEQLIQVARTNGKRPVAPLPSKPRQSGRLGLEPLGRRGFKLFHQRRHIHRTRHTNGKVNVVLYPSYPIAFAFGVSSNRSKIRMELGLHRGFKNRRAVFRTEDHMDQKECQRLCHRGDYRSDLQPSLGCGNRDMGLRPMLV
jgi:hypothetical protein